MDEGKGAARSSTSQTTAACTQSAARYSARTASAKSCGMRGTPASTSSTEPLVALAATRQPQRQGRQPDYPDTGGIPTIVDQELEWVQKRMDHNRHPQNSHRAQDTYLLSGHICCCCSSPLSSDRRRQLSRGCWAGCPKEPLWEVSVQGNRSLADGLG